MKKRRLKGFVVPVFSAIVSGLLLICIITIEKNLTVQSSMNSEKYTYVDESAVDKTVPVMNEDDKIIRPYVSEEIDIYKKFYNGEESSIIYLNGTYIQNSGIIYTSSKEFNVVSVMDGEVIEVKKNDVLNYVVEVKHSNDLISIYEGLKSVNVKKGDHVNQNDLIGKSGEIKLDTNLSNSLLFEITRNGKYVNPEEYFDKSLKEL